MISAWKIVVKVDSLLHRSSDHDIRYGVFQENPKMPQITALWMNIDQTEDLNTFELQAHKS